jgi:hypothetical protein
MYGIMSGLEPRGYADGDLVQKALQLGVQPFGMSDEEIMQAIMQKQQVDEISAGGDQGVNFTDQQFKDNFFDYTDPLEYATLPLVSLRAAKLLGKPGQAVYNAVRGPASQLGGKISQNIRGIGAYIGVDELARRGIPEIGIPGYENPFGKDAQDEAAEDLAEMQDNEFIDFEEDGGISLIDPDKPMEKGMSPKDIAAEIEDKTTPFDEMKGIKAFAKFASQLGATPGETEEMTGGEFISMRPFEAPGVMRMANGGIAQFAFGGPAIKKAIAAGVKKGISALDKPIQAIKKEVKAIKEARKTPKASTKKSDSTDLVLYDEAAAAGRTTRAPSAMDAFPPLLGGTAVAAGKALKSAGESLGRNKAAIGAGLLGYGLPAAGAYGLYKAVTGKDDDDDDGNNNNIATGGGDKDVLDADSSLRDFNYAKALERAQAAGRTEPTFVDYVASFPASYTDKLGKDPEFAKQMMAGFVAMMTPSEGIVERSGLADFAGGVMAEQARQEGEVPDQIKLLEAIQKNPEILKAMRQLNAEASDPMADANAIAQLKTLLLKDLYGEDAYEDDDVILDSSTGRELTDLELLQMYKDSGGNYNTVRANIMAKAKV